MLTKIFCLRSSNLGRADRHLGEGELADREGDQRCANLVMIRMRMMRVMRMKRKMTMRMRRIRMIKMVATGSVSQSRKDEWMRNASKAMALARTRNQNNLLQ